MSKLSIYENGWINLVFEGRNKEYGAYQLRQQSDKNTLIAFLSGISLVACALCLLFLGTEKPSILTIPESIDTIIKVTDIQPNNQPKPIKLILPVVKKTTLAEKKEQLTNPKIVKPDAAPDDIAKNTENNKTSAAANNQGTETGIADTPTSGSSTNINNIPSTDSGTGINLTTALDKLPEFPGGMDKFYQYVGKNFNNPEVDEAMTMRVYVSFVIEKDGSMSDIQVRRDPGYGLGREAIRVLKSLKTKWAPGIIGGKAVRTAYNLPITVQMQ